MTRAHQAPRDVTATVTSRCGVCGREIDRRERTWCSNACRQAAYRRRHPGPPADAGDDVALPPARRPRRDHSVYACPVCDARLVGVQRCPDCNVFARREGTGGECPSCGDAITVAELLGQ